MDISFLTCYATADISIFHASLYPYVPLSMPRGLSYIHIAHKMQYTTFGFCSTQHLASLGMAQGALGGQVHTKVLRVVKMRP